MLRAFTFLSGQNDWRLVALAVVVCFVTSVAAVNLFHRARATAGRARIGWLLTAGLATGVGFWATHFIAMLAYQPGVFVGYDFRLTALSRFAAVVVTTIGLGVAIDRRSRWGAPAGGAVIGAGVAMMQFIGMAAMQVSGHFTWSVDLVALSIILGVGLSTAALAVAARRVDARTTATAALLLTFAVVLQHFIAMGAIAIIPDPALAVAQFSLSPAALSILIASVASAVLGVTLAGAIVDIRRASEHEKLVAQSEEKLREQNLMLETALDHMTHGLCMFDADAHLLVANRRYVEMYDLPAEKVKPGCTLRDLIEMRARTASFSGDPYSYCRDVLASIKAGVTTNQTLELPDGRTILLTQQPMANGGWVATHLDISGSRRAEQAIKRSRVQAERAEKDARDAHARLLDAFEVVPEGFVLFDAEDRFVMWNRRYLELYPESVDAILPGTRFEDSLRAGLARGQYPDAVGREEAWLAQRLAYHRARESSHEQQLPNGRWVRVQERRTSDGGSIGVRIDITELKQREASFRLLFESNPVPMWLYEEESLRFLAVNDAAVAHYGYLRERFLAMTLLDIRPAEDRDIVRRNAQGKRELRDTGRTWRHLKADGTQIDVAIYRRSLNYEGHAASLVAAIDLTERKRAEDDLRRTQTFLDTIVENMPAILTVKDFPDLRYILVNRAAENLFGVSRQQMIGKRATDLFPEEQAEFFAERDAHVIATGGLADLGEHVVRRPNGHTRVVSSKKLAIAGADGKPQYVLSLSEDVTKRKETEQELRRTKEFLNTVIENVPEAIMVKDVRDFRYVLVNRAAEEFFGRKRDEIIGHTAEGIFDQDAANAIMARDLKLVERGEESVFAGHPLHTYKDGDRLISSKRLIMRGADGEPQYLLGIVEDITERMQAEARIAHMAHHDTLTDLPNRVAFNERFCATLNHAAAAGERFAVMCIDLDRFKEVNDVFGHAVGDAVLCEAARRLTAAAEGAFVARLGGDEFTLIATGCGEPEAAERLAERLAAAMADEFRVNEHYTRMGMSVGVALYPADGVDASTLLANADAALYRAKAQARGSIRFFEPEMDTRLRERRALQRDLQSAIEAGELILHYQPQARIDRTVVGFEALARWQHPSRGMVPPGTFIPLAEETGLIVPMGEWILREACREAASWPQPLQIAINLSPVQFRHGDLAALVHTVLLETGLAASRLELEITEGVLIGDFSRAVAILRRLKSLGVRIAMDDFGTGYSSLSYLQSFPFDKIKIDQAFISNLERNAQSAAIVRAVIGLGRGLGLPVVAEGVETEGQLAFLTREACDEIQGYLIGRPLPIEDYAKFLGRTPARRKAARKAVQTA
jgi:diguanylate cyclase (GGDEF)-like protein/PAS domain S-box-containing protein